jgi:hypothetical protein
MMPNMKMKSTPNIRRLTLKGWAAIDDLGKSIVSAYQDGECVRVAEIVFQTIEMCVDEFDRDSFWMDAVELYNKVLDANRPTKNFPILSSKAKGNPLPWEYNGRSWYFWLNMFGEKYGWEADAVGALDIDDAIGLYQEIEIDDQIEKEWQYGLSEISYEYDKNTKKSKFRPLPRPDWMKPVAPKPQPVKKIKLPAAMIPVGVVNILDEE